MKNKDYRNKWYHVTWLYRGFINLLNKRLNIKKVWIYRGYAYMKSDYIEVWLYSNTLRFTLYKITKLL